MRSKGENILVNFLELLKVKHTSDFSNKLFNEHPHKYNLFGLSKILSDYGVNNAATKITDKENDIAKIETPFIAHFGGDFAVVQKVESEKVSFLWRANDHVLPISEFVEGWTGVVLLAETSEKSIEPDYKEHKKKEFFNIAQKSILFLAGILILGITYINKSLYACIGINILIALNLIGVYISYLLLLKQMRVHSQYADKICSLFKQTDCNNVLETKAAKLWGIFGWSEIGLGYFVTNLLILLFFPALVTYIALINIVTLPYSFWSVWYQYVKAKQWCPLCLIVQVLLWAIFIANFLFSYVQIPILDFHNLLYLIALCSCYVAAVLGINLLVPKFNADRVVPILRQAINGLKADEGVFKVILKQQPYYEVNDFDSIIRFGNSCSPLKLTVLTNPYCNPCSMMHKRIEKLLQKTNNNISVQYILSSFEEKLNSTNKYLIAACFEHCHSALDSQSPQQIFTDWFEKGKKLKDEYFKNMNLDMDDMDIEIEFDKHEEWKKKTQLRATPTILVNGYQLPENYKVEDLLYFTELNIEI